MCVHEVMALEVFLNPILCCNPLLIMRLLQLLKFVAFNGFSKTGRNHSTPRRRSADEKREGGVKGEHEWTLWRIVRWFLAFVARTSDEAPEIRRKTIGKLARPAGAVACGAIIRGFREKRRVHSFLVRAILCAVARGPELLPCKGFCHSHAMRTRRKNRVLHTCQTQMVARRQSMTTEWFPSFRFVVHFICQINVWATHTGVFVGRFVCTIYVIWTANKNQCLSVESEFTFSFLYRLKFFTMIHYHISFTWP